MFSRFAMMKKAETDGYRRLLNIMHMNITQNTDIIDTLKKQGSRMEEERTEDVKKYIEDLSGVPESLLSIGMIGPIILAVFGLFPQLVGESDSSRSSLLDANRWALQSTLVSY